MDKPSSFEAKLVLNIHHSLEQHGFIVEARNRSRLARQKVHNPYHMSLVMGK